MTIPLPVPNLAALRLHRAGPGDRRLLFTGGMLGLAVRLQRGAEAARDGTVGQGVDEGRVGGDSWRPGPAGAARRVDGRAVRFCYGCRPSGSTVHW
ncbi:hypothetical protein GCM10010420_55150 [Streptomyces glaucosporus]|uniref:Uncharacterized protein n=1 Tax=Streptomyces glaucosporus TaxID=284044 RepID=A0ABP5W633_9ACTN